MESSYIKSETQMKCLCRHTWYTFWIIRILWALYSVCTGFHAPINVNIYTYGSFLAHKLYDLYVRQIPSNFHLIYARIYVCFPRDRSNMEFYINKFSCELDSIRCWGRKRICCLKLLLLFGHRRQMVFAAFFFIDMHTLTIEFLAAVIFRSSTHEYICVIF